MLYELDGSNGAPGLNLSPLASMQTQQASEHVAILLSTYNGASFLARQLDSLIAQTHQDWTIYASDDGSSDSTLEILEQYREKLGAKRLEIIDGPRQGFCRNFFSLIRRQEIQAPYYAFCDQDDLWFADRLSKGLQWMRTQEQAVPALFCSRTQLIDEEDQPIGLSPLFSKPPCFENALVQSIAGGNTMLLNRASRDLLAETPPEAQIVSHDWWAYMLVTGCGGQVAYEPEPTIGYRQHGENIVGSNSSLRDRLVRARKMCTGTFRTWTDSNLQALSFFKKDLTPRNQLTLLLFERSRQSSLANRLRFLYRSSVHRQSPGETLGLVAAAVLHRI